MGIRKAATPQAFRQHIAAWHIMFAACSLVVAAGTAARTVERIEVPKKPDGVGTYTFPPGQNLSDLSLYEMVSYEGEWQNSLAHGEGMLRFPDTDAGGYLSTTLPGKPNYYIGTFVDGRPAGSGTFVHSSTMYTQSLTGMFSGQQLVYVIEGQELSVITGVPGATRALVRAMQYPGWQHRQPSRMFFGEIGSDGVPKGGWVDVPWFVEDGDVTAVGFGRVVEQYHKDGSKFSCTFAPRASDRPNLTADLVGLSGNIEAQRFASLDVHYASKADCISTNPQGWTWSLTVDQSVAPAKVVYVGCKTPSGKSGRLKDNGTWCEEKKKANQDVFTNIAREFKRFVDRRIIGSIDKIGGSMEKAMCRATGTEPGKNCNVNVAVGASWPVGEGTAPGLPAAEQEVRNSYIAAVKRASALPGTAGGTSAGDAIAMAADLNAVCTALCHSEVQRRYSATLLTDLERVARQPMDDGNLRAIASIQRETANVMSGGLRSLMIGSTVAAPIVAWFRFGKSAENGSVILDAIHTVVQAPAGSNYFEFERQRTNALKVLTALQTTNLNNMVVDGANLLGTAITTNIRVLRGFPPRRVRALTTAIQIGRTERQVQDFIERYKDVTTEEELYEAIIKEALAPMGIAWPQKH